MQTLGLVFVSVTKHINLNPIVCRSLTLIQDYILNPNFEPLTPLLTSTPQP